MDPQSVFLNHLAQTSPFPLKIEVAKAEGTYIYDVDGKSYLDFISGIAVTNIGHRHPHVVNAIKHQLDQYMHVMAYGEFIQTPQNKLAEKLASLLPPQLNSCYFVNSGAEANEGALKLAKRVTGRTQIISCKKSYHGSTHGALSVSGNEVKKYAFRPLLPDVHFIEFNKMDDLAMITTQTACVIIEPIQGDAGVRIPSLVYMKALRERCTAMGALLIFDEIQTGFGRTGTLFCFEQMGVIPDILTIAKAMGGGMPIGGFISSKENMDLFTHNPMLGHITTFGGHPVVCASALANLEVIENESLLADVEEKGALIESLIGHPKIIEIRRRGLMFAVEFESAELVAQIVNKCLENGLITFWFLSCPESFRLAPPLTISVQEIEKGCKIIRGAIEEVFSI
ncbi:MAG: aspartate aminotransferase family protein [Cytophagales bacterium CG12_big_fil_rev_8_21_14_0_65_40_12]|nr:MAG: aspartate aminotransferase family protein [Cytophagales bacterium CG12_big_fil_rev_8_21_14_0_65_40_12]PIW03507.1 MAG: aspartate aminotransferase family protein [Cytophagales bacterium CG17_big_fil_post_rev_8_21_14_2_50_40_13]